MALGPNSYGSVAEVAALTLRYTDSGSYNATTRPTLSQVETFLDRVSGVLNVLLAGAGFAIPVTQPDAKLALDDFAVDQAAALAHAANGAGPYAPGSETLRHRTPRDVILTAAREFVVEQAHGLEALGAERPRPLTYGLTSRQVSAIFRRRQMDDKAEDWDGD